MSNEIARRLLPPAAAALALGLALSCAGPTGEPATGSTVATASTGASEPASPATPVAPSSSAAPAPKTPATTAPQTPVPDVARLTADVTWLADDAREGRRSGERGNDEAAAWIATRMGELGLEPAGEGGTYRQELTVPLPPRDGGGSWLVASETTGFAAKDPAQIRPLFCSEGGEASGSVYFAGYGIVDESAGRDDYGVGELPSGFIALVVRSAPVEPLDPAADAAGGKSAAGAAASDPAAPPAAPNETAAAAVADPHGEIGLTGRTSGSGAGTSLFAKVMAAKRKGAAGVLIALHPERSEELLPFDVGRTARAGIPAAMISAELAAQLFEGYRELVAAADRGEPCARAFDGEARLRADVVRAMGRTSNVLGLLRGRSGGRTTVVGAHFDHLGRGGLGSLATEQLGEIHNGADDNASGTAVALEMARLLAADPPAGDVLFALWSAEEEGLLGSEHWMQHPTVPLDRVAANLNLDMVGRAGNGKLSVLGAGTSPAFASWMDAAGAAAGLELAVSSSGQGIGGSDHQSFLKRKIPALHFFSGVHTDYHKPSDDTERFEAEGAARVTALGIDLVRRMSAESALAWVEPPPPESAPGGERQAQQGAGWRTWLGSVPEYGYDGKGVLLGGTSSGSPAERAGLLRGDVLVQIGDVVIDSIYDQVYALQVYKPGNVVVVRFLRDGREEEVRVTLSTRDIQ